MMYFIKSKRGGWEEEGSDWRSREGKTKRKKEKQNKGKYIRKNI